MPSDDRDEGPGVRFPPPRLYIVFLVLGIALSAVYPAHLLPWTIASVLGAVILAAGMVLGPLWGIRTMRAADTTVRPDRAASHLVTGGPFSYSRNPLYVALTLMYVGIAIIANSIWALLLVIPPVLVIALLVIPREEAHLKRVFGEEYERYQARVRRWL